LLPVNHPTYGNEPRILDELHKSIIEDRFNEPLNITAGGGFDPKTGIHSSIRANKKVAAIMETAYSESAEEYTKIKKSKK